MREYLIKSFKQYYLPIVQMFLWMILLVIVISVSNSFSKNKNIDIDIITIVQLLFLFVVMAFVIGGFCHIIYEVIVPWRDNAIFKASIVKNIKIENFKIENNTLVGVYNGFQFTIFPNAGSEMGESIIIFCSIDIRRSEINWLTEELKNLEVRQSDGYYFVRKEIPLSFWHKKEITNENFINIMNEISTILTAKNIPPIID